MMTRLLLLLLSLALAAPAMAQEEAVPESAAQLTLSFAPIVRTAAPAVVNIYSTRIVRQQLSPLADDPFFRQFFGDRFGGLTREREARTLGSGVIVRADGLIVTNHHVIDGADEITVALSDRSEYRARILLSEARTDLALLQLDGLGERALPTIALGDSDSLEVGDLVLAIGNPFGVGQTVTGGIVSALARAAVRANDESTFIQTDAAINPGNSGGALVDMHGELVGINTAIFSRSGGSLGIGFAVPSNLLRSVIASVDNGGRIVRPWLGAEGQPVTPDMAAPLGLDHPTGVLVNGVDEDGPAARAGLAVGDVVLAVNGRAIDGPEALRFRIATLSFDAPCTLSIARGGERLELALAVEPPPETPPRQQTLLDGASPLSGATVANLSPALVEELGYAGIQTRGVIVLGVAPRSRAARVLGLQAGDVLMTVNDRPVETVDALEALLSSPQGGGAWRISIRRGDRSLDAVIRG